MLIISATQVPVNIKFWLVTSLSFVKFAVDDIQVLCITSSHDYELVNAIILLERIISGNFEKTFGLANTTRMRGSFHGPFS